MSDDLEGSVTGWIGQLELSEADAAQRELWGRYFHKLVDLARQQLGETPRRAADEEDVAIVALTSFFDGARQGRFPQLQNRHDLWPLLVKITACKAHDQQRRMLADKRGGGHVRGDSIFGRPDDSAAPGAAAIPDVELRPDELVAVNEQCQRLMTLLPDDKLREVARRRLEGYTNAEIAEALGVMERTIERRIALIRNFWSREIGGQD
jgi:DNA-directed RNA polymerase specialized sigma24 family protein